METATLPSEVGTVVTLARKLRWRHVCSAVALVVAVKLQLQEKAADVAHVSMWLIVAMGGHLISKLPGGDK
jgi:hypothetical protein